MVGKKHKQSSPALRRLSTGIDGLDPLIDGGFIEGQTILICGMPGTGKTILGLQYLYKGIVDHNEPGLFITVESNPEMLKKYALSFGWDLQALEDQNKLAFLDVPIDCTGYKIIGKIRELAEKIGAKRIVHDSLSALSINAYMYDLPLENQPDPTGVIPHDKILHIAGYKHFNQMGQFTYLFVNRIGELGATALLLTDSPPGTQELTKDGISEFAADGVIQLQLHDTSRNVNRTLAVKKMRGTKITPGMNSLKFTESGLHVGEFKAFY